MAGASAGVPAVPKVVHLVLGRDEAAALGAASVAIDIGGGLEYAKSSVIIAACAMNAGALATEALPSVTLTAVLETQARSSHASTRWRTSSTGSASINKPERASSPFE